MNALEPIKDPRLDTREKRTAVARRLNQPGWVPRNASERSRNRWLEKAVMEGWAYIPTLDEPAAQHGVLAEIDASRVSFKLPSPL